MFKYDISHEIQFTDVWSMSGFLLYDITVYPYQFIVTVHDYCLVSSHSKEGNTFSFLHCVVRYYRTCDEKTITATNFCKTLFVQENPIFEARISSLRNEIYIFVAYTTHSIWCSDLFDDATHRLLNATW